VSYHYKAVERFWKSFYALGNSQKESSRQAWKLFKMDPFDPRLGSHKIHKLLGIAKTTIYSAVIEGDLRVLFRIDGDTVTTLDIGTHDAYK
jgi:Txe/YoeB family toxin of Txe-Axe toxin-antitoxin module